MATVKKNAEAEPVKTANEPKYSVNKLRKNAIRLFNVSQSTFDGAMYGHTETEYTVKEAEAIIREWLYGKGGKK